MSNKIDTRSVLPTLSEVVKQARTKEALASSAGQTKTASVAAPVAKKTASAPAKPAVKVAEEKEKEEGGGDPAAAAAGGAGGGAATGDAAIDAMINRYVDTSASRCVTYCVAHQV